ncbi:hypothetical protein PM082_019133 [Marasmius tenuissimus]|nr:hypothetical protein PM082_019133 [Marasmius tenuissimus]
MLLTSLSMLTFSAFRSLNQERSIICSKSSKIYTVDSATPRVECIGIYGSNILDTGSLADVTRSFESARWLNMLSYVPSAITSLIYRAPKVTWIDENSIIVPGLADAHAHIIENGFKTQLQLDTAKSVSEVIERVKAYILARPDIPEDRWIEGMGWNQEKWPEARFPTAADLDADPLLKGRPIALRRVDGHATWVSSRGLIVRDEEGRPTGVFVDNAIDLIPAPEWSEEQLSEYFNITMTDALSFGLTSIHDADTRPQMRKFFIKQAEAGRFLWAVPLDFRLNGLYPHTENPQMRLFVMLNGNEEVPPNGQLYNHGKHGRLTIRSIKLYTDGALGSWGAALLEPYTDKPDTKGIMRYTHAEVDQLIRKYWKAGWQVNVHCIGDKANHVVLDVFEDIIKGKTDETKANVTEWRPRIEHAQIMTQDDLKRAGALGVITSVQPTHGTSDMWYAETRLGPDRIKGAYAYQTLLKNSPIGILPLGSDFPIEGVNPLLGFYAAVAHLAVDGTSPHGEGGWYPSERLTRAQALKGMTLDAAYASFTEKDYGSLEPGKKAEFVILDKDIMTVPFEDILQTKVRATVIDGRVAYGEI